MRDDPAPAEQQAGPEGLVVLASDRLEAQIAPLGARVHRLRARRRRDDAWHDLVLHLPDDAAYLAHDGYLGATVGRVANRIASGDLPIGAQEHRLATNDRGATLHGGPDGFDRRRWSVGERTPGSVELHLISPDGDQGFPGEVRVTARFEVRDDALHTTYTGITDAPTALALSSHAYYRLGGADVTDHVLQVPAKHYHPVDHRGVPTGETAPVETTPFDLRGGVPIGAVVEALGGLDHDLVPDGVGLREVARLSGHGWRIVLSSDQPGLQVYTASGFDGRPHPPYAGVALEPQLPPDAVHHPAWPSPVLRPGETYRWRSVVRVEASGAVLGQHQGEVVADAAGTVTPQ